MASGRIVKYLPLLFHQGRGSLPHVLALSLCISTFTGMTVGVLSESGFAGFVGWQDGTMERPWPWPLGACPRIMRLADNRKTLGVTEKFFEITCPSGPLGPRQSCGEFGAALSSGALSRNHSCPLWAPWAPASTAFRASSSTGRSWMPLNSLRPWLLTVLILKMSQMEP